MFKSLSIKIKLLGIVISSILLVSIILGVQSVNSLQKESNSMIAKFEEDAYKTKEKELQNYISLAMKTVESYYKRTSKEQVQLEVQDYLVGQVNLILSMMEGIYEEYRGTIPDEELKSIIKNAVKATTHGKDGYFWINDFEANIIMHPIKPHFDGRNLANYADKNGKKIYSEFARVVKDNRKGFVEYVWPKPGFDKPQAKVSYVKLFRPFKWVVGTGEYIGNVTEKLQEEAKTAIGEIRFGEDSYYWINDSSPKMIMHPIQVNLDDEDLSTYKDKKGKFLFKEMSKVANNSPKGGLVKYMWSKPNKKEILQKFSYVQKFEPWDWIIGTGTYIEDIDKKIILMQKETAAQIEETIIENIITTVVIIFILTLIMIYISNKIIFNPLNSFQDGLLNFFKYINKESNDVQHLDDSSSDEIGTMARIINKNVERTKSFMEEDEVLIGDVKRVAEEVKKGLLIHKVESSTQNIALQELKTIFNEMLETIQLNVEGDINKITEALTHFKELNFTHQINNPSGNVSKGLNDLSEIINKMLLDNLTNGLTLQNNSKELSSNVNSLSTSSNSQAASLEETAAALEQITSTIINNTDNISQMAMYSSELTQSIKSGQDLANSTVVAMNDINSQTQAIADAITVIDQIAFQTNILSLNAAVEAATAGEAGKGFAVVAQEVRNLASRSADAAREIKELVEHATSKTNTGKQIADKMIVGYEELNKNIVKTTETITDIETASKEQQVGIEQINDAITSLDQGTQKNAMVASQTAQIAKNTSSMASEIVEEANKANFFGKEVG